MWSKNCSIVAVGTWLKHLEVKWVLYSDVIDSIAIPIFLQCKCQAATSEFFRLKRLTKKCFFFAVNDSTSSVLSWKHTVFFWELTRWNRVLDCFTRRKACYEWNAIRSAMRQSDNHDSSYTRAWRPLCFKEGHLNILTRIWTKRRVFNLKIFKWMKKYFQQLFPAWLSSKIQDFAGCRMNIMQIMQTVGLMSATVVNKHFVYGSSTSSDEPQKNNVNVFLP